MNTPLDVTLAYHERTKHRPGRYARALGYMDWATQPDPFRRFEGARRLPLDLVPIGIEPADPEAPRERARAAPLDRAAISQLFQDALGLSAWKQAGASRWALRVNPSSGNLHPTEGYLVSGPIDGLHDRPAVYHYAPFFHALELRVELSEASWSGMAAHLPREAVLLGLTSIHWRESWKYGERAFRYCQHDVGHAIGSVAIASSFLGWEARLLEGVADAELAVLLGLHLQSGIEAEHADVLMAVCPMGVGPTPEQQRTFQVPTPLLGELRTAGWSGQPNRLSESHHEWSVIDDVAAGSQRSAAPAPAFWAQRAMSIEPRDVGRSTRTLVHQRRSAVDLDGRTGLPRAAFYEMLSKLAPSQPAPIAALPWRPCVDLLLFVHRVDDVTPGLYALVREPARRAALMEAMNPAFGWSRPAGCPESVPLFLLDAGDARSAARQTSCGQDIAADGAFAVAMLADYRATLVEFGAWFYRRLHWETGAIGQVLYLEAEAHGIRATGIGCYFDDLTHELFGLRDDRFQVLYHFTMGGPVEDPRLQTQPPYAHLAP